jgi:hypothetical protein
VILLFCSKTVSLRLSNEAIDMASVFVKVVWVMLWSTYSSKFERIASILSTSIIKPLPFSSTVLFAPQRFASGSALDSYGLKPALRSLRLGGSPPESVFRPAWPEPFTTSPGRPRRGGSLV